jgi:hypothetical protein
LPQCGNRAEFDIAIVGTSLLCSLLAGVLARDHGKKVVRIGRPRSAQRLPRSLDLALPLATRPETWRHLRRAEAETRTLLGSIGVPESAAVGEVELVADLPPTASALDHLAHMALGHDHRVRRTATGWAFRQVTKLDAEAIERRLGEWLTAAGAATIDDGAVDATTTVLADDDAIFDGIAEADRPAPLLSQAMTSTLLVSRPLPAPIRRFADRGVTLVARPGSTVLAIVSGEQDVDSRLASTLPGPFPMKRLATTRYRRFTTRDGAPVIGKLGKQVLIAGLADAAPFFAPSLARLIAGSSEPEEKRWFAAHDPAKDRTAIADFVSSAAIQ